MYMFKHANGYMSMNTIYNVRAHNMTDVYMFRYLFLSAVDGDEDEGDELSSKRRKPWGDTSYYCPVSLKDQGVLWPGNLDICSRYKERLYSFSTDEAKEKFTDSPENYIAQDKPLLVRFSLSVSTSQFSQLLIA